MTAPDPPPDPAGDDVHLTAEDVVCELRDTEQRNYLQFFVLGRADAVALVQRFADQQTAALRGESAHVAVELEAMRVERDQAVAIARDVTERAERASSLMREAADRIRQLETELQALADAHGTVIVAHVQLRETVRQLQEQNTTLATVVALGTERGVA